MNPTTQLETVIVMGEKFMDWAISSQALQGCREGSTTSAWSPDRTVKRHECGTCDTNWNVLVSPTFANTGDTDMADRKFFITAEVLKNAYDKHGSPQKLADLFGVSKKLVLNYMQRFGIERNKRRTLTREHIDAIRRMAASGCGVTEIAEEIGFSSTTVRKWATANGVSVADTYHTGRVTTDVGYVKLLSKGHPRRDSKGYVHEHVLVMEAHLGRHLSDDEVVHHKDRNKANNAISNLQLMTDREHRALHLREKDSGRWSSRKCV